MRVRALAPTKAFFSQKDFPQNPGHIRKKLLKETVLTCCLTLKEATSPTAMVCRHNSQTSSLNCFPIMISMGAVHLRLSSTTVLSTSMSLVTKWNLTWKRINGVRDKKFEFQKWLDLKSSLYVVRLADLGAIFVIGNVDLATVEDFLLYWLPGVVHV